MLNKNNKIKDMDFEKGAVSIIFGLLLLSMLLVVSSTVFILMFQQMKMSGQAGRSVVAFYAAEAGAEKCLYQVRSNTGSGCDAVGGGTIADTFSSQSNYQVNYNGLNEINSVGRYLGATRKLKLTWE